MEGALGYTCAKAGVGEDPEVLNERLDLALENERGPSGSWTFEDQVE